MNTNHTIQANTSQLSSSIAFPELPTIPSDVMALQQEIVTNWLGLWKCNFVAHAIWDGNFQDIVNKGCVLPAEAVLRRDGKVEREAGVYGCRTIDSLPTLSEEELKTLEVLDDQDEQRIIELKEKLLIDPYTEEDKQTLKKLEKPISSEDQVYQKLKDKKKLHKELKKLNRFKLGINLYRLNFKRIEIIQELAGIHRVNEQIIKIAYDKQRGNLVDHYLAKKFKKSIDKNPQKKLEIIVDFINIRQRIFGASSLNSEIRASKNRVSWPYGNVAILRGDITECKSTYFFTDHGGKDVEEYDHDGVEIFLRRPFQNEGKFFVLPLAQPNTLILGYYKDLSPHADELEQQKAKYVYIESLTDEQRVFFKVK